MQMQNLRQRHPLLFQLLLPPRLRYTRGGFVRPLLPPLPAEISRQPLSIYTYISKDRRRYLNNIR